MNAKNMYEVLKCAKDPLYFAENYYASVDVVNGLVKGSPLYSDQKTALELMVHNQNVIGLTARQTGMTRLTNMYALWDAIFTPDRTVGIVCPKMQSGYYNIEKILLAYEQLPKWMKPDIKKMTKNEIIFGNDSRIFAKAPSSASFCGMTVNTLMVSDVAFMDKRSYEEMSNSLFPIVSCSASHKLFIWSAPNGDNFFKKMYKKAKSSNDWANFKLHWTTVPNRGKKWKANMIDSMGAEAFKTEYQCKFR
jgi:hypothetical protein